MKTLLDLEPADCRWPIGSASPQMFCAEPKFPGSSYCACHKTMSVNPDQPVVLVGRALSRMANAFGGGKPRDLRRAGNELGRPAIDSLFVMSEHLPLSRDFFPPETVE